MLAILQVAGIEAHARCPSPCRSLTPTITQAIVLMTVRRILVSVDRFLNGEEGIAITEYGLLIALVAILMIGVVSLFSSSIASWFTAKSNKITSF